MSLTREQIVDILARKDRCKVWWMEIEQLCRALLSAEERERELEQELDEQKSIYARTSHVLHNATAELAALRAKLETAEGDLLRAAAIGMATILTRCGAYESLSPYMKAQWDELQALHAKCDAAFKRNMARAALEKPE